MKYENRNQLKKLLLNSTLVVFNRTTQTIYFSGLTLERCEIKLPKDIFEDIYNVCRLLEIEYIII